MPSALAWELARSLRLRFLWCFFFRPLLPPPLAGPGEKPVFILERSVSSAESYEYCRLGSFMQSEIGGVSPERIFGALNLKLENGGTS